MKKGDITHQLQNKIFCIWSRNRQLNDLIHGDDDDFVFGSRLFWARDYNVLHTAQWTSFRKCVVTQFCVFEFVPFPIQLSYRNALFNGMNIRASPLASMLIVTVLWTCLSFGEHACRRTCFALRTVDIIRNIFDFSAFI